MRWVSRSVYCLFFAVLFLSSCQQGSPKLYNPSLVDFTVTYNPYLEGQFYPSLVMALASTATQEDTQFAINNSSFSISVISPVNRGVLRIVIDSSKLNYVTILQEEMPRKGERYTYYPSIKWKFDKLYGIRQQGFADMTFTCYINDEEVDVKNLRINYRSVGDCLLSVKDDGGRLHDYRWMVAAYVNEEHPFIDSILTEMLNQGIISRITGYQSGRDYVVKQVEAIWYYALQRGITYSSISCATNPTKRSNVQHIRFFDEVYNLRQANCIDACVFFASIMRKIGLKPLIFIDPCHAYLGYYTDKNRKQLKLLETTITSWVDFPALDKAYQPDAEGGERLPKAQFDKVSKYLDDQQIRQWEAGTLSYDAMKRAVAHTLFQKASEHNSDTYKANKSLYENTDSIFYQQLDIEQLRNTVRPISE